jgi:O-antigen/teichoic acid export membrane protein
MGLLGGAGILIAYMLFAVRGLTTAARAKSDVSSFTAVGLTSAMSNLTDQYLAVGDRAGTRSLRKTCLGLFYVLMVPVGGVTLLCSDAISVYFLGDARTRLGLMLLIPCLTLTAVENLHKNAFYGAGRPIPPAAAEVWEQIVRAGAVLGLLYMFLPQYPERAVGLVMWGMILCEVSSAFTLSTLYRHYFGDGGDGRGEDSSRQRRSRICAIALPVATNALLGTFWGQPTPPLFPDNWFGEGWIAVWQCQNWG